MLNTNELTEKLRTSQARWQAADDFRNSLPTDRLMPSFGVEFPANHPPMQAVNEAAVLEADFTPSVDWRDRNGSHITPVKNQGGCNASVAFGTVAVVESMISIEKGKLLDLSEADHQFCSNHGANCNGWVPADAFKEVQNRGVCSEITFPYPDAFSNRDIFSGTPACHMTSDRNESVVKISQITTLASPAGTKSYLTNVGPVAAIMEVHSDFIDYKSGIYHHVLGELQGLQCVEIIGYSEFDQCWIGKNSWGTEWGEQGFFRIAYGEAKIDSFEKVGVSGVVLPTPSHKWFDYENLGPLLSSRPAAVSWAKNRIDVVVRGADSAVWHRIWNGSQWNTWESLGGFIQGAPAICSRGIGRLNMFAAGGDHALWHRANDGVWNPWESLGGLLMSEPACVSWGNQRIDIVVRDIESGISHKWWDGQWHDWESLGGIFTSAPAICSPKPGMLSCFATGTDSRLYHRRFDNGWGSWESINVAIMGAPAAQAWGPDRIDVFYRGLKNQMMHIYWNGLHWSAEEDLGGTLSFDVGVSSSPGIRLDCFVTGTDSSMYHKWFA